MTIIIQ